MSLDIAACPPEGKPPRMTASTVHRRGSRAIEERGTSPLGAWMGPALPGRLTPGAATAGVRAGLKLPGLGLPTGLPVLTTVILRTKAPESTEASVPDREGCHTSGYGSGGASWGLWHLVQGFLRASCILSTRDRKPANVWRGHMHVLLERSQEMSDKGLSRWGEAGGEALRRVRWPAGGSVVDGGKAQLCHSQAGCS